MSSPSPKSLATPAAFVQELAQSGWPWLWLLAVLLADLALFSASRFSLAPGGMSFYLVSALQASLALALATRSNNNERAKTLFTGVAFLTIAWPALRMFNHLTAAANFPLVDAQLLEADRNLGFDWFSYLAWLDTRPALLNAMGWSYSGFSSFVAVVFVSLLFQDRPAERSRELARIFLFTALIAISVGALLPAVGEMAYLAPKSLPFRHIDPRMGTYALEQTLALRGDPHHVINPGQMPGLVTFPSFHTAMGVIAIYCSRSRWWLLVPTLVFSLTMIASTPVFGSHYLIDLIFGTLTAVTVIFGVRNWDRLRAANTFRYSGPGLPAPVTSPAT